MTLLDRSRHKMFNKVFDKVVNVHTSDELERNLEGIAGYVKYEGF